MKWRSQRPVAAPVDVVRRHLWDVPRWGDWLPGLRHVDAVPSRDPRHRDVILRLAAPRELTLRLAIQDTDEGVSYSLVEGDAVSASGQVSARPDAVGTVVLWEQELQLPVSLPGPLVRELEEEVGPRWLAALAAHAQGDD